MGMGTTQYHHETPQRPRLEAVTNDVREGNQALRATVYPDDNASGRLGARAEVVHWDLQQRNYSFFSDGQEVEYRWYTKIPGIFPMENNTWHIITQWHQLLDQSKCWRNGVYTTNNCNVVPLVVNLNDYNANGNPTLEPLVINIENDNVR
jgi:hypothetical protein